MDTKKLSLISLEEIRRRRKRCKKNLTEEKLAVQQPLKKIDIPDVVREFIEEALEVLVQLTAYYKKGIPFDKALPKDFVQAYLIHSGCTKEKQLRNMILNVAAMRIKKQELPNEKSLFDASKIGTFVNILLTQKLRNSTN